MTNEDDALIGDSSHTDASLDENVDTIASESEPSVDKYRERTIVKNEEGLREPICNRDMSILIIVSCFMWTAPFLLMALAYDTVFKDYDKSDRYLYTGFVGIGSVLLIIIGYILYAVYEKPKQD